jgi:hypothetical protein
MSTQLHSFITNVLAMPHYSNQHAGSGVKHNSHEDALTAELTKVGYIEIVQTAVRVNRKGQTVPSKRFPGLKSGSLKKAIASTNRQHEIAKLVPGLLPGQFICQPAGSQSFPDFLICDFSGTFVIVEAKSGGTEERGGRVPAWNDSLVKKDAIYIFSSGFYNETTVFLGQDVLDQTREQFLIAQYEKIRQIIEETKVQLNSMPDPFHRGFGLSHARPKFEQGGGNSKCDYFKHAGRAQCENNVLMFAQAQ